MDFIINLVLVIAIVSRTPERYYNKYNTLWSLKISKVAKINKTLIKPIITYTSETRVLSEPGESLLGIVRKKI